TLIPLVLQYRIIFWMSVTEPGYRTALGVWSSTMLPASEACAARVRSSIASSPSSGGTLLIPDVVAASASVIHRELAGWNPTTTLAPTAPAIPSSRRRDSHDD